MGKYICTLCGTSFNSKLDANECRKSHRMIEGFKTTRWSKYEKYPQQIKVEFEDGNVVVYKRGG